MRNKNNFPDRKLIKNRYTGKDDVEDGIYYFIYSFDNGTKYKGSGVIESILIEETYLPNSSYKPGLKN